MRCVNGVNPNLVIRVCWFDEEVSVHGQKRSSIRSLDAFQNAQESRRTSECYMHYMCKNGGRMRNVIRFIQAVTPTFELLIICHVVGSVVLKKIQSKFSIDSLFFFQTSSWELSRRKTCRVTLDQTPRLVQLLFLLYKFNLNTGILRVHTFNF